MKKLTIYGCMGAIALCSIGGLTACSSDIADSSNDTNKNTGERSVVKTQFAINLPHGASETSTSNAKTRMTDTNTQQNNNFRGIQDLALLCFDGTPGTGTDQKSEATKVIYLSSGNNAYSKDAYRALYRDIEIPTGTTHFIMNGRALHNGESEFAIGKITPSDTKGDIKELSQLNYSLNAIQGTANFANNESAQKIIEALNNVRAATADYKVTESGSEKTVTVNWKDAYNTSVEWPSAITSQERTFLAQRYKQFVSLTAGSAASVKATLENLQQILIGNVSDGTSIPTEKAIQKAIYDACTTALGENYLKSNTFPQEQSTKELPDGVAKLKWIKNTSSAQNVPDSVFAYVDNNNVTIGESNKIDYTKITYPAEISYTISTPGMVSESDITTVNQLPEYNKWISSTQSQDTWGDNWNEAAVTTRTRSVALKLPVQYSVACLKTTVKCNSAELEDNGKKYVQEDQKITVPTDGFQLTGILVGGQPAKVGWDFYPTSDESFANTVYDRDINPTSNQQHNAVTTSDGTPNYTLLLDNKVTKADGKQSSVYVTLELKNTGKSFYGYDGLIPAGGTFYLVGILSSENFTDAINHAFLQDYTTTANFTIKNLKNAYNCIPDLRTSGLNVGLAVDLTWQAGITFDVDL